MPNSSDSVVAAAWMIWHPVTPPVPGEPVGPDPAKRWLLRGLFFVLGCYSGFIQAGVGFLFLALLSANGLDLVRGNAVKVPLILAFTTLGRDLLVQRAARLDGRADAGSRSILRSPARRPPAGPQGPGVGPERADGGDRGLCPEAARG